jgi:hypothetical protein
MPRLLDAIDLAPDELLHALGVALVVPYFDELVATMLAQPKVTATLQSLRGAPLIQLLSRSGAYDRLGTAFCRGAKTGRSHCAPPRFTVRAENEELLTHLLDMQPDEHARRALVSSRDEEGYTALERACMWGCPRSLRLLLRTNDPAGGT